MNNPNLKQLVPSIIKGGCALICKEKGCQTFVGDERSGTTDCLNKRCAVLAEQELVRSKPSELFEGITALKDKTFQAFTQGAQGDYSTCVEKMKMIWHPQPLMVILAIEGPIYITKEQAIEFFGLVEPEYTEGAS